MKTTVSTLFLFLATACVQAQTAPTATISGSLRINDSLQVLNNITAAGDIMSTGELIAKDTVRAQKDVLVGGSAAISSNLSVSGNTQLQSLLVNGPLVLQAPLSPAQSPCISLLVATLAGNGGQQLAALSPADAVGMETLMEANPCPQPPVIPFTWQTYGNHANTHNRWIGTLENYDFNIRTDNTLRLVCKANGDIGLGAFGGNAYNSIGKKYRLFIANTGELSAGEQDASGKYPFVVKPNGSVSIGMARPKAGGVAANAMLSVDGLILAKEIKVAIANTHWADYVFDRNYPLKPLREVEAYIRRFRHLPEVPTEMQVNERGIDLVEMNATLLKKIEELTLYLIEQEKRLEQLEQERTPAKR